MKDQIIDFVANFQPFISTISAPRKSIKISERVKYKLFIFLSFLYDIYSNIEKIGTHIKKENAAIHF